jgi:hypothetical protein
VNPEILQLLFEEMSHMIRKDAEGVAALCDWSSRMVARDKERRLAEEEGRQPRLVPIALVEPSLVDLGVHVSGCSACVRTPEGEECLSCCDPDHGAGTAGLAPSRTATRARRAARKRRSR